VVSLAGRGKPWKYPGALHPGRERGTAACCRLQVGRDRTSFSLWTLVAHFWLPPVVSYSLNDRPFFLWCSLIQVSTTPLREADLLERKNRVPEALAVLESWMPWYCICSHLSG
jgi:hypothetical protein